MKLISCHIENFGKIHDYSIDFNDGVNKMCEENGWGKSTLAAFIQAMFYGFEGDNKRSIEGNERKKYKPWQGGAFGGEIVFEIGGKMYLISRVFKDKKSNDEFELRDASTNLPSEEYSDKIGEEIFKINKESFARTVFIAQSQCETAPTDDINAKIGQLADNSNDLNNFEAAAARLTSIINELNPNRATGSISKRNDKIAEYNMYVKNGESISDSIRQYQEKLHDEEDAYDKLKMEIDETGRLQEKASRQQALTARKSEWERLKGAADRKKKENEECRQTFPGELPDLEEVKKRVSECSDMERARDRIEMHRVTQSEKDELAALGNTFAEGTPAAADFTEMLNDAKQLEDLSRELASEQMTPSEKERLGRLESYFEHETENIAVVTEKWNSRNTKKNALPSKRAALTALRASMGAQPQQSKQTGKTPILIIIGILLVAVGGMFAVMANNSLSSLGIAFVLVGIGIVIIIVGIFFGRKAEPPVQQTVTPEYENLQRDIEDDEKFIARADEEVAAYLSAHGKSFNEYRVSSILQEITAEAVEYSSLKKKMQNSMESTKAADLENIRQKLDAFLGAYGAVSADGKFTNDLYMLKNKAESYSALSRKQADMEKAENEYQTLRNEMTSFLEKYNYQASDNISRQLSDIRDGLLTYQSSLRALEEASKELGQFEAANDISELEEIQEDESLPALDDLNRALKQYAEEREKTHKNITDYNKMLENLQEEYDEWEEKRARLEELNSLQSVEKKKYEYVNMAKKKLELAKEAITAKYSAPILQSFSQYYEMITNAAATNFHIDANTKVTVDEQGKQREINTLSLGYKDLIGICLRTALVDAMYQEETPPLIMDDPFTNLDDSKVKAGMDFINELARKYQIIYFTCSNSRK